MAILSRHREEIKLGRYIFILFLLVSLNAHADTVKLDCLPFEDSNGNKVCEEYTEQCNDSKGRFVYCEDAKKLKNRFKKIVKKCRSEQTGKFIKCPSELK